MFVESVHVLTCTHNYYTYIYMFVGYVHMYMYTHSQVLVILLILIGQRVLEEILTPLVERLQGGKNEEEREMVLDGLQQIMAVKSNAVLPMIIPRLVQPPANTRALALFSSVAGPALYRYLPRIIPALVTSINQHKVSCYKMIMVTC